MLLMGVHITRRLATETNYGHVYLNVPFSRRSFCHQIPKKTNSTCRRFLKNSIRGTVNYLRSYCHKRLHSHPENLLKSRTYSSRPIKRCLQSTKRKKNPRRDAEEAPFVSFAVLVFLETDSYTTDSIFFYSLIFRPRLTKPAIASAVFETVHRVLVVKLTHKEFN